MGDRPECSFDQEKNHSIPSKLFHSGSFLERILEYPGFQCAHGYFLFPGKEMKPPLRGFFT